MKHTGPDFECPIPRGAPVVVTDDGIAPWGGTCTAIKWSSVSGWWVDVFRASDGMTWTVPAHRVEVLPETDV